MKIFSKTISANEVQEKTLRISKMKQPLHYYHADVALCENSSKQKASRQPAMMLRLALLLFLIAAPPRGGDARSVASGVNGRHQRTKNRGLSVQALEDVSFRLEPWIRSRRGNAVRGVTADFVAFGRSWHLDLAPQNEGLGWDRVHRHTPGLSDCTFYRGKVVMRTPPLVVPGSAEDDTPNTKADIAEEIADVAATWCARRPGLIVSVSMGGLAFMVLPRPATQDELGGVGAVLPPHLGGVARGTGGSTAKGGPSQSGRTVLHRVFDERDGRDDDDVPQGGEYDDKEDSHSPNSLFESRRTRSLIHGNTSSNAARRYSPQDHDDAHKRDAHGRDAHPEHTHGCGSHELPHPARPLRPLRPPRPSTPAFGSSGARGGAREGARSDDSKSIRSRRRATEVDAEAGEGFILVQLTVVVDRSLCSNMNQGGIVVSCLGGMAWAANLVQTMDM